MKISALVLFAVIVACAAVPSKRREACQTICPAVYDPVCGSDGKIYGNACSLEVQQCLLGDSTLTEVPCGEKKRAARNCDWMCPQMFDPVCGSDGITYSNKCFFGIAQCENSSLTMTGTGSCD